MQSHIREMDRNSSVGCMLGLEESRPVWNYERDRSRVPGRAVVDHKLKSRVYGKP